MSDAQKPTPARNKKKDPRGIVRFRHKVVFTLLRPVFRLYLALAYGYKAQRYRHPRKEPVLVLANHNCNLDPFFVAVSFNHPLYFVASDQIFRLGFLSKAMKYLVAPIPIIKSKVDLETIRTMVAAKNAGGSVCLFPEGNRSFNGVTGHIPPSTAKLLKMLGIPVILYKIRGGYLSTPRWSNDLRKGRMYGGVERVLSVQDLAAMSADEINDAINGALYENAFETQAAKPVAYKSATGAQYLERVLFLCPSCHSFASMTGQGDVFGCACGYRVRYNEFGLFEGCDGKEAMHPNVYEWDKWQRDYVVAMARGDDQELFNPDKPILCDDNEELHLVSRGKTTTLLGTGRLCLFCDRLEFREGERVRTFPLRDIGKMIVWGTQLLQFSTLDDASYELKSKRPRSAYKYMALFNVLEQKRRGLDYGFFGI